MNNIEDSDVLVRRGVPVDAQDREGRTALLLAVMGGDVEATELLVRFGADPRIATHAGETRLSVASQQPNRRLALALQPKNLSKAAAREALLHWLQRPDDELVDMVRAAWVGLERPEQPLLLQAQFLCQTAALLESLEIKFGMPAVLYAARSLWGEAAPAQCLVVVQDFGATVILRALEQAFEQAASQPDFWRDKYTEPIFSWLIKLQDSLASGASSEVRRAVAEKLRIAVPKLELDGWLVQLAQRLS